MGNDPKVEQLARMLQQQQEEQVAGRIAAGCLVIGCLFSVIVGLLACMLAFGLHHFFSAPLLPTAGAVFIGAEVVGLLVARGNPNAPHEDKP